LATGNPALTGARDSQYLLSSLVSERPEVEHL
jgi:hypothetical protein